MSDVSEILADPSISPVLKALGEVLTGSVPDLPYRYQFTQGGLIQDALVLNVLPSLLNSGVDGHDLERLYLILDVLSRSVLPSVLELSSTGRLPAEWLRQAPSVADSSSMHHIQDIIAAGGTFLVSATRARESDVLSECVDGMFASALSAVRAAHPDNASRLAGWRAQVSLLGMTACHAELVAWQALCVRPFDESADAAAVGRLHATASELWQCVLALPSA